MARFVWLVGAPCWPSNGRFAEGERWREVARVMWVVGALSWPPGGLFAVDEHRRG